MSICLNKIFKRIIKGWIFFFKLMEGYRILNYKKIKKNSYRRENYIISNIKISWKQTIDKTIPKTRLKQLKKMNS